MLRISRLKSLLHTARSFTTEWLGSSIHKLWSLLENSQFEDVKQEFNELTESKQF